MKRIGTLRVRFALWTATLLLLAFLLFGLFVYTSMSYNLSAAVDETLRLTATELIVEAEVRDGLPLLEDPLEEVQYTRLRQQGLSMRVLDRSGQPVQLSGPYQDLPEHAGESLVVDANGHFATQIDSVSGDTVRVYTAPIDFGDQVIGILQLGINLDSVNDTLTLLLISLLIGGPLIVVIAATSGYFLAARALAPIDSIRTTAAQISATDLAARLNLPRTDDEVGRLAATFDSMLERLDNAFRRERQFTADASHELRTPLSAMQTIIGSTTTRTRTPAEYEQALADLGTEVEQMKALTEGLLLLARNESRPKLIMADRFDLSTLLTDVVDSLRPAAEAKGLALAEHVSSGSMNISGDSDGLIRLFVNLLTNAIKYTKKGEISVSLEKNSDKQLVVSISDTGMGIASEHIPYIFDRFYRMDSSRTTDGIGLGLAIAQNIAIAHGGRIFVESEVGKGSTFRVELPATSPIISGISP